MLNHVLRDNYLYIFKGAQSAPRAVWH